MSFRPLRALRILAAVAVLGMFAREARADLVWSPDSGWRIEGGALSGLTGDQGRNALQLMNKARRDEENHSYLGAVRVYTKVCKKYSTSVYAPEAFYRIGLIRFNRRQYYKAFDAFQILLGRYPNSHRYTEVIGYLYQISAALLNGDTNHAFGFLPTFRNRERAVQYEETILADAPYSDFAPLCLMEAAEAESFLHNPDLAIDELDKLVNTYPQSVLAPEAYLRLAEAHASQVEGPYYDQAETNEAITYSTDFTILFPTDKRIGDAAGELDKMKRVLAMSKIKIGDFYFYKRDNYPAARVFYNEAITSYPDSSIAEVARKRLNSVEIKANAAAQGRPPKKHFLFF
ncbi:MAG TPA: tetratricopeptide repeat protein [Opitutaceae bacterium]|jgi:outer membrane protein assembly factor BamD